MLRDHQQRVEGRAAAAHSRLGVFHRHDNRIFGQKACCLTLLQLRKIGGRVLPARAGHYDCVKLHGWGKAIEHRRSRAEMKKTICFPGSVCIRSLRTSSRMATALKVLVCGDVQGQFGALMKRVTAVNSKAGPFDMLLCTGSFFAADGGADEEWTLYKTGKKTVPLPVYVMGAVTSPQIKDYSAVAGGGDLCENVTYLGLSGVMTIVGGIRVGYLGGMYDPNLYTAVDMPQLRYMHTAADVSALQNQAGKGGTVDILLSSVWPQNVLQASAAGASAGGPESPGVAAVARALKPRYHFASGRGYFEREPYQNHSPPAPPSNVTRFLAVAAVNNPGKEKWLYAFNVVPAARLDAATLAQQPDGTTANPYVEQRGPGFQSFFYQQRHADMPDRKRKQGGDGGPPPAHYVCHKCKQPGHWIQDCPELADERAAKASFAAATGGTSGGGTAGGPPPGYVCRKCNVPGHFVQDCPELGRERQDRPAERKPQQPTGPCWFCLGSPEVEKQLVVSVGTSIYAALSKGWLVDGHVLLLPIQHFASSSMLSAEALAELEQYKASMRKFYDAQGYDCVLFERNYRSQHMQLQVVPVPKDVSGQAPAAFQAAGAQAGLRFQDITADQSPDEIVGEGAAFFLVEYADGRRQISPITGRFSLQFGREVLASGALLDVPDRVDWKSCVLSKEEEKQAAADFKKAFRPFDFNFS
eukprot:m.261725 g.261725  ORF g.261725 m.261725 type:complete len:698 (-) comp22752_c0_seq2:32-2125(-)